MKKILFLSYLLLLVFHIFHVMWLKFITHYQHDCYFLFYIFSSFGYRLCFFYERKLILHFIWKLFTRTGTSFNVGQALSIIISTCLCNHICISFCPERYYRLSGLRVFSFICNKGSHEWSAFFRNIHLQNGAKSISFKFGSFGDRLFRTLLAALGKKRTFRLKCPEQVWDNYICQGLYRWITTKFCQIIPNT